MKPSDREVDENPRARSAVMRVARRLPVPEGA
jgi:16S rRNA (cytosine1402-N4)-methyltransferase